MKPLSKKGNETTRFFCFTYFSEYIVMPLLQQKQLFKPVNTPLLRQFSIVIIAQNEEECIANAIRSCQSFADEIVVVDSGSTDATVQIAHALGCRVYHNAWSGYSDQRNFGADHAAV